MTVLVRFCHVAGMIVFMPAVVAGVVMIVHVFDTSVAVLVEMLMRVLMGMIVCVIVAMSLAVMGMFMGVRMSVVMRM